MTSRSEPCLAGPFGDASWRRKFRRRVLAWFRLHARDLPWRISRDPYRVWVSEIMLQQTQVSTVVPYYQRFLAAFPTIEALAEASEQQVLRFWEGLGYYRRARMLHQAARIVVRDYGGRFPDTAAGAARLPGIGRYTAGAIISIAFDAQEPILEANTTRLFSRLLALRGDPASKEVRQRLWQFAEALLPSKQVGQFNQALMELGSEVCTPRNPECAACPVGALCPTRAQGLQDEIPSLQRRQPYESVREACVVVRNDARVLIRHCSAGERWAGLWDFPRFRLTATRGEKLRQELAENVQRLTGIRIAPGSRLTTLRHGVTRFRITLQCYEGTYQDGLLRDDQRWVAMARLRSYPLHVTGRKIATLLTCR